MRKHHRVLIKIGLTLSTIPIVIWGYASGPEPNVTGAPGDQTCIQAGCHTGTANSGPGNVKIILPSGNTGTYTPGQAMQLTVQITDTTKRSYGFELTARAGTGNKTQAGTFSPSDAFTQLACLTPDPKTFLCPANSPDIEHTQAGWMNSVINGKSGSYSYTFTWTPPSTDVGAVTLYVAANCGTGADNQLGTNVYLANMALTAAAANPNTPSVSSNGIVPLFSTATTIQPGSWISIYGNNLGTTLPYALWNGDYPTNLGGVSVKINGKPGYLYFASPTQINLQAPDDTATGSVPVVVTNGNGSVTTTVTLSQFGPSFSLLDSKHVAGIVLRFDGSGSLGGGTYDIVGPTGTSLGYKTVAAKAGDNLVLFGVGFGPTTPFVGAGQPFTGSAKINDTSNLKLLINNVSVTPAFAGLTSEGLYQFNLTVPSGLGTGDVPLQAMVGGVSTPTGVVVSLQ